MFISIEDQVKMAMKLCEQDNVKVLLMCLPMQAMHCKNLKLFNSGIFNSVTLTWAAPNGSTIYFRHTERGQVAYRLAGFQFTHVIINESQKCSYDEINWLRSRLRSVEYKGQLMLFMPKDILSEVK